MRRRYREGKFVLVWFEKWLGKAHEALSSFKRAFSAIPSHEMRRSSLPSPYPLSAITQTAPTRSLLLAAHIDAPHDPPRHPAFLCRVKILGGLVCNLRQAHDHTHKRL